MTFAAPLQHALLGLAVAALAAFGLRLAGATGARGLERILAAAPIAAAAACAAALALGLVGLGGEPPALTAAAALAYGLALAFLPTTGPSAGADLLARLRGLDPGTAIAVATLAGGALAMVAWFLRYPLPGTDSVANHVPIALEWVQSGVPGSVTLNSYEFPTGAYPLTNELLLGWAMGIARSLVPATLLAPAMALLLVASGWAVLRELRVPRLPAALAVAAVVSLPLVAGQLNEAKNDIAATAWTACAMALALATRRRPALAAPALLAAALAIGTKTTVVPLAALAAGTALYAARHELGRLAIPLGGAAAAGLLVGGLWYVRNLFEHGSPLWPFVRGPFGDPLPPLLTLLEPSFLDRPDESLDGRTGDYAEALAGGLLLLALALVVPLVARGRAAVAATGVAAVSLLLWLQAPVTGRGDLPVLDDFSIEATRYLLPALAAAAVALAAAARAPGAARVLATGALTLALVWNLVRDAQLGFPQLPGISTLAAGAVLGAIVGALALALGSRASLRGRRPSAAVIGAGWMAAAGCAGALVSPAAERYGLRHARTGALDAELVRGLEGPVGEGDPVDFIRFRTAMLAGDRLERRLRLLRPDASCARRPGARWLVLLDPLRTPVRGQPGRLFPPAVPVDRCRATRPPVLRTGAFRVYPPTEP